MDRPKTPFGLCCKLCKQKRALRICKSSTMIRSTMDSHHVDTSRALNAGVGTLTLESRIVQSKKMEAQKSNRTPLPRSLQISGITQLVVDTESKHKTDVFLSEKIHAKIKSHTSIREKYYRNENILNRITQRMSSGNQSSRQQKQVLGENSEPETRLTPYKEYWKIHDTQPPKEMNAKPKEFLNISTKLETPGFTPTGPFENKHNSHEGLRKSTSAKRYVDNNVARFKRRQFESPIHRSLTDLTQLREGECPDCKCISQQAMPISERTWSQSLSLPSLSTDQNQTIDTHSKNVYLEISKRAESVKEITSSDHYDSNDSITHSNDSKAGDKKDKLDNVETKYDVDNVDTSCDTFDFADYENTYKTEQHSVSIQEMNITNKEKFQKVHTKGIDTSVKIDGSSINNSNALKHNVITNDHIEMSDYSSITRKLRQIRLNDGNVERNVSCRKESNTLNSTLEAFIDDVSDSGRRFVKSRYNGIGIKTPLKEKKPNKLKVPCAKEGKTLIRKISVPIDGDRAVERVKTCLDVFLPTTDTKDQII
ncbi:unnamed protein product [Owenia fusiformis]|uniref:Uncharacterized protein n=1 Tax=Owenia fusiformis TaxID=6347 RepID=A0A8J1XK50_OWEFU|nr:unnamed protein product [Owenia fusiformis]